MKLRVLGSGSAGNCYLFEGSSQTLIVECGVRFREVQKAIGFDYTRVAGCLITHEDGDHCKYADDVMESGINVHCSTGTAKEIGILGHHRHVPVVSKQLYQIGEYKVLPFTVNHDAAEPMGFLIQHPECGTTLFVTDSYYSGYRFKGLNNILVEANFCQHIIDERTESGKIHPVLRSRIMQSHMSIQTCLDMLRANDLSQVNNIVLVHLSDSNSNASGFKKQTENVTGKTVHIADRGLIINIDKTPF